MARYKNIKLEALEMKTLSNVPFEKILVIQGRAMRVNLPVGMQSSDYPKPEMVTKPAREPGLVIQRVHRRRSRAGRKRSYVTNAARQRAYRDRKRSQALRNRSVSN